MQNQLAVSNINLEQWVTVFDSSLLLDSMLLIMVCLTLLMITLGSACLLSWSYKSVVSKLAKARSLKGSTEKEQLR